jgi:hypothetical protein
LISACKPASTRPSIEPTAPEIHCKQPATPPISKAPREEDWVDQFGQLSEVAANWISELLGTVNQERKFRDIEHRCLDDHEKRGDIRQ